MLCWDNADKHYASTSDNPMAAIADPPIHLGKYKDILMVITL